jgi:isopenicillin-N N-acyltransferase like protein
MRQFHFEGTPEQIGEAYGEQLRDEIAQLYAIRLHNALAAAKQLGGRVLDENALLTLSRRCLPPSEAYDAEGYRELAGIARGAGMSLDRIFAMNGLTDLRNVLAFGDPRAWGGAVEGCSSFIVGGDRTQDGRMYVGQTWDLATDHMPFVIAVHRKPKGRPATWSMTTSGCLSLIGMNEQGAAVGTTNIRTKDSRPGVTYLQIIHRTLREAAVEGMESTITLAPRAGAHYYYAGDARERAIAVECTATQSTTTRVASGYYIQCNHVLIEANRALEAAAPARSSLCRQARMGVLIGGATQPLTVADFQGFLADHDGGDDAICMHDRGGLSSNGSIIMCPRTQRLWVCHGQACTGTWVELAW